MDNNTLASNIIESLAWPATVLIVLALFRKELAALLRRIRKGQFGDATVEFEAAVAEMEEVAQEKRGVRKSAHAPARIEDRQLAETDPRRAVNDAWRELDARARSALKRKNLLGTESSHTPITRRLEALSGTSDAFGEKDLMMFRELQDIRSRYVRDYDFRPSPESVIGYMTLAKELGEKFETIG